MKTIKKYLFTGIILLLFIGMLNAIEHVSKITTPIILFNNSNFVSQGTGFYFAGGEDNSVIFLVSNYHVFAGTTSRNIDYLLGNNIEFYIRESYENTNRLKKVRYPLLTQNKKPVWITSKNFPDADVAVIPIISSAYKDCSPAGISSSVVLPTVLYL